MKIHILRCGYIQVAPEAAFCVGKTNHARLLAAPARDRLTLPVCVFLIEHPRGLILVDTGWRRDISPEGVYDLKAVGRVLPASSAALFRPYLPEGMAVSERLSAMGIRPQELECVLLTHLDPDHTAGLAHLRGAKRIVVPEDEYFWSGRSVYKKRQVWSLWTDQPIERLYYRASSMGPRKWAIDLFGDESVLMVNVPGHTDGQAAIVVRGGGKYVLLAADAAFSPRNWTEMVPPGFGFDRGMQLKSLEWIAETASDSACAAVFCSHDPDNPDELDF